MHAYSDSETKLLVVTNKCLECGFGAGSVNMNLIVVLHPFKTENLNRSSYSNSPQNLGRWVGGSKLGMGMYTQRKTVVEQIYFLLKMTNGELVTVYFRRNVRFVALACL